MAFKMAPKSPALRATGRFSSPVKQVNITDTTSAGDALTTEKQIAGLDKALGNESAVVKGRTLDPGHQKIVDLAKNEGNKTKGYVKEGGTATGNMKDYKIGSQERADEYNARGWKQDHTTQVKKEVKAVKAIKQVGVKDVASEPSTKLAVKQTAPKKEVKQSRSQKIRAKGEAALASGDKKKAHRLRKRFDRVEAREAKKAARNKKPTSPAKIAPLVMALAPMAIEMMKGDK